MPAALMVLLGAYILTTGPSGDNGAADSYTRSASEFPFARIDDLASRPAVPSDTSPPPEEDPTPRITFVSLPTAVASTAAPTVSPDPVPEVASTGPTAPQAAPVPAAVDQPPVVIVTPAPAPPPTPVPAPPGGYRLDYSNAIFAILNQIRAEAGLGQMTANGALTASAEYYTELHVTQHDA